jgi:hypothetical protein
MSSEASPCPRCLVLSLTDEIQTCRVCGYPAPRPDRQDVVTTLGCLALLEPMIDRLGFRIGHDVAARADHAHALQLRQQLRVWMLERFPVHDPPLDPVLQGLFRQTIALAKEK